MRAGEEVVGAARDDAEPAFEVEECSIEEPRPYGPRAHSEGEPERPLGDG